MDLSLSLLSALLLPLPTDGGNLADRRQVQHTGISGDHRSTTTDQHREFW